MRGMRAVAEALRLEDFPEERMDIDYAVGDIEVEDGKGGYVPVRELTEDLRGRTFRSAEEVVRALQQVIAERARRAA